MSAPAVTQVPARWSPAQTRIVEGPEADVLGRLGPTWTRIERVPFGSTVDIDHVLLSTAGVFVVETTSTTTEWVASSPELLHAISETRWRARKIGFLLDRVGRPFVTPVLVVSGPGAPVIPGGSEMVDGVLVCRGVDAARWCAHLDALPSMLEPTRINEMLDILVDHTVRTDQINRTFA